MTSTTPQPETPAPPPSPFHVALGFAKAGAGSAASLLAMALLNKVLAVLGGPATVGLFSLLRQAEQTGISLASSDGDRALVQGISARRGGPGESGYVWNIGRLMAVITLAEIGVLQAAAPWISQVVFRTRDSDVVLAVRLLGVPLLLAIAGTWLIAILKARLAVGQAALARTIGATAGFAAAFAAARQDGPAALVIVLIVTEGAAFLAAWGFVRSQRALAPRPNWSWAAARADGAAYLAVAGYLLLTGVLRNLAVLVIRSRVLLTAGLAFTGFFEAAWTIAAKSLFFLLDAISTYYLPLLSAARGAEYRPQLLRRLTRIAWAAGTPASVALIALKPLAIEILYASGFLPALPMLRWMLIGVYFQATGWPFSTAMLAFGDVRDAFRVDALWLGTFLLGSLISLGGTPDPEGIGIAYLIASAVTLAVTGGIAVRRYALPLPTRMVFSWSLGLAAVLGASWATWQTSQVSWAGAAVWIVAAGGAVLLGISRTERTEALGILVKRLRR
jgi:O-antigen/teichoic acid export membrane protein